MLRVQSFSRSWDVAFHLSPEINAKQISSCSAFPSVCSATMPSHSEVHFIMVVKPGTRPDFLENIFTPNINFVFLRDGSLTPRVKKSKKNFSFFYYSAPLFYRVWVIPNNEISGTYRVPDEYPVHPYYIYVIYIYIYIYYIIN